MEFPFKTKTSISPKNKKNLKNRSHGLYSGGASVFSVSHHFKVIAKDLVDERRYAAQQRVQCPLIDKMSNDNGPHSFWCKNLPPWSWAKSCQRSVLEGKEEEKERQLSSILIAWCLKHALAIWCWKSLFQVTTSMTLKSKADAVHI